MKNLILFLCLSLCMGAHAKTFYFSDSQGNDANTSTQAQNSATPWKSLSQLSNAAIATGDSILFKSGDVFFGSIELLKGLKFNSYGTGKMPEITGFYQVTSWTENPAGSGIYESEQLPTGTTLNMVNINGKAYAMGRYPNADATNAGYLNFESHATNSITDNQKPAFIDATFNNAQLVIRVSHYQIGKATITGVSGNTISYSGSLPSSINNGYGYFLQNSIKTLDQFGEWYYNPSTKKISVYFGSAGTTGNVVKVAAKDILIQPHASNLSFNNIQFTGANTYAFYSDWAKLSNLTFNNCKLMFAGNDLLYLAGMKNTTVINTVFNYANGNAVALNNADTIATFTDITVKNIGMNAGMIAPNVGAGIYATGIYTTADSTTITGSNFTYCGFIGVNFSACSNVLIDGNNFENVAQVLDDGGPIYCWTGSSNRTFTNRVVSNNTVQYAGGSWLGTPDNYDFGGAIYADDNSTNVVYINNTVAHCLYPAFYVHNSRGITIRNNNLFDNLQHIVMQYDGLGNVIRNVVVKKNNIVAPDTTQMLIVQNSLLNDHDSMAVLDSNFYWRPFKQGNIILRSWFSHSDTYYNLDGASSWQSITGQDANSRKGTYNITSASDIIFNVNRSSKGKTIRFCKDCFDLNDIPFFKKAFINPHSSYFLIKKN